MAYLNDEFADYTLLTETQASLFLGFSPRALQAWRYRGGGPLFVKVSSRCVRYRKKDLIDWAEYNTPLGQ